jgi:hypothetical protein
MTRASSNKEWNMARFSATPALTATLAALIAAGISSAALAQDTAAQNAPSQTAPAPVPLPQAVPAAPIGHRQPRPAELPRDVRRDERAGPSAAERTFDKKLENSICRGC